MPDNPFNAFLDPSKQGTLSGAIGGLMGNPTQSQAAGSATGRALQELSQLRANGDTPQAALLKWFQTPSGQDFFANAGPEGMKSLTDGLTATTPPSPVMHNVPEGGQLYGSDPATGKVNLLASNPKSYPPTVLPPQNQMYDRQGNKIGENTNQAPTDTPADVRSFQFFSNLSNLPQAEVQRLAKLKIDPTSADKNSVASQAVDTLVEKFGLDPRLAESIKAGTVKITPLKNEYGQDTGAITVYDLSNPDAGSRIINPGGKGPAASTGAPAKPLDGTSPDTGAATGVLPPVKPATGQTVPEKNPTYFGNKASMFLGSGAIATGLAAASGVSEQINPKMIIPQGAQAEDRQNLINTLRSDLAAMGTMGGGISVNKGVIEGYMKLAPSGGVFESPHQAVQKAIRLYEHIEQEVAAEGAKSADPKLNIEERKASSQRSEGWKRVLRDLPSYAELTKMESDIRGGTAGAPTISEGIKTVVGAGAKALTEGKRQAGELGLSSDQPNIDAMNDPKELLAIDPRTLNRENKIKYLRKIDAITKGGGNRSDAGGNTQVADVTQLHPPGTFSRNTQGGDVINGVAKELKIGPPNNVIKFPPRGRA